jgi:Fuseless
MLKKIKHSPQLLELKSRHPNASAVIVILAIILIWRGVWGLLDTYLFPDSPTLSNIVSAALGIVILYLDGFHINNLKR